MGLISGQGAKIPHAVKCGQKHKNKKFLKINKMCCMQFKVFKKEKKDLCHQPQTTEGRCTARPGPVIAMRAGRVWQIQ